MNDLDSLLLAILDPATEADDGLRLAYADLLEEAGQPERAEFIRVQVELANWPCECDSEERVYHDECRCGEKAALRRRERELLEAHERGWLPPCVLAAAGWCGYPGRYDPCHSWQFRRGFVHAVTCAAADWLTHAEAILAAQPVREVRLTTPIVAWTKQEPENRRVAAGLTTETGSPYRPTSLYLDLRDWHMDLAATDHPRLYDRLRDRCLEKDFPHVRFALPPADFVQSLGYALGILPRQAGNPRAG